MAAALTLGWSSQSLWAAQPSDRNPPKQTAVKHVKSRILVQPKAGLSNAELDKILKTHGGRRTHHLPQINVHVVELPAQASEIAVINILRGNPHIKFAELDVALEPNLAVNDPYYSNAWHLPKIGVPQAWDIKTGAGVVIAILDTGVDSAHPDLSPQMVPGWNTYDNNNNTSDVHGHGTMVSGMAVAAGNNAAGSAGVAFGSKLMPIRITDTSGYGYFSTMASGIMWAADQGARVASISFQGAAGSSTVNSAAQYMRSKGGVVLTASGNTGVVEAYAPSDYLTVVSASDSSNNVASFSSYGEFVDISAPGVSIFSTKNGGGYGSGSGTSAASPVAAGVYALMMAANPSLSPATLDNIAFTTALDVGAAGKDLKAGWGVVNAGGAVLKAAQTMASDSTAPSASIMSPSVGTKVGGLVPVGVNSTDNLAVTRVELYVNGSLYATDITAPYAFSWDTSAMNDGSATLLAKAYDAAGNIGSSSVGVIVANDTMAPEVTIQNPANGAVLSGTVTVSASATDNKKVASMSLYIDGKEVAKGFSSSLSYSWDTGSGAKKKGGGKKPKTATTTAHAVQVVAIDPAGNKATKSISVTTQ
jgi:hypothetical protein